MSVRDRLLLVGFGLIAGATATRLTWKLLVRGDMAVGIAFGSVVGAAGVALWTGVRGR